MRAPHTLRSRDQRLYPLANSELPPALKSLHSRIGDKDEAPANSDAHLLVNEKGDVSSNNNDDNDNSQHSLIKHASQTANRPVSAKRQRSPSPTTINLYSSSSCHTSHCITDMTSRPPAKRRRPVSPVSIPESSQTENRLRSFKPTATSSRLSAFLTQNDEPEPQIVDSSYQDGQPNKSSTSHQEHGNTIIYSPTPRARRGNNVQVPLFQTDSFIRNNESPDIMDVDDDNSQSPFSHTNSQRQTPSTSNLQTISSISQSSFDTILPSPSLSPVTAMNSNRLNDDSVDDTITDLSLGRPVLQPRTHLSASLQSGSLSTSDIPGFVEYFDSEDDEIQKYIMFQLLRRCPRSTLLFVSKTVEPALKIDVLDMLPPEVALNVVSFLDYKSMCRASQVSKKWRQIINSDEGTWKRHFDEAGFVLPERELKTAIEQGWGWQNPHGAEDYERNLRLSFELPSSSLTSPSSNRRSNRKASLRVASGSGRKAVKRSTEMVESVPENSVDKINYATLSRNPFFAAKVAATTFPLPPTIACSLGGLHLFKSIFRRHHRIQAAWTSNNIKPLHLSFPAHPNNMVTCLQFDSDRVLTGSDDTTINVFDIKTGALCSTLQGHEGGVWALQYYKNTLVSGSTDRTVRVWDVENGECSHVLHGHSSTVRCLKILQPTKVGEKADGTPEMMPESPIIITGARDATLKIWKLPQSDEHRQLNKNSKLPTKPIIAQEEDSPYFLRTLAGHQHSVRALDAHGDILASGSYDCTVRVWKISTGEAVYRLQGHTYRVYSVVLDHKRNRVISGSMDNLVKIWSLDTGALLYNLDGHTSLVGLLDLQGDRLVSAAADATLRIWDPEDGHCKNTLTAHTGAITCFQHDHNKVISGSDRTLKMWDVKTGECQKDLLTGLSGVWQVRFDGRRCVAAVQRTRMTYLEVLDFGASSDQVPPHRLGRRIVVNRRGQEIRDSSRIQHDDDAARYI